MEKIIPCLKVVRVRTVACFITRAVLPLWLGGKCPERYVGGVVVMRCLASYRDQLQGCSLAHLPGRPCIIKAAKWKHGVGGKELAQGATLLGLSPWA